MHGSGGVRVHVRVFACGVLHVRVLRARVCACMRACAWACACEWACACVSGISCACGVYAGGVWGRYRGRERKRRGEGGGTWLHGSAVGEKKERGREEKDERKREGTYCCFPPLGG